MLGDVFSRLPWLDISTSMKGKTLDPLDESLFFSLLDQPELAECFLNLPDSGILSWTLNGCRRTNSRMSY
jgi:hypothetical protein